MPGWSRSPARPAAAKHAWRSKVATAVQPAYANGVWLVELASLYDPTLVPHAVATSLELTLTATAGQSASALLCAAPYSFI